jgi:hypothetical protein
MATITAKTLAEPAFLLNVADNVISNPAATVTYVRLITIHNTDAAAQIVQLWFVPNGGPTGASTQIFEQSVDPDETIFLALETPGYVLFTPGDAIRAKAAAVSTVVFMASGFEEA